MRVGFIKTIVPVNTGFMSPFLYNKGLKSDVFEYNKSQPAFKGLVTVESSEDEYQKRLKYSPETAFLYKPGMRIAQKRDMAQKSEDVLTTEEFAQKTGVPHEAVNGWIYNKHLEVVVLRNREGVERYVDTKSEKNAEFLNSVEDKLKTSMIARDFLKRTNMKPKTLYRLINEGKIELLSNHEMGNNSYIQSVMIDCASPKTRTAVADYLKTHPIRSKNYYKEGNEKELLVPAAYLQKLGFGDAKYLRKLVKEGYLPGKIIRYINDEGNKAVRTLVDIAPIESEGRLCYLRDNNPNVFGLARDMKYTTRTMTSFKEDAAKGKIDIIPEAVFSVDLSRLYYDKTNPKNKAYFENLDNELLQSQLETNEYSWEIIEKEILWREEFDSDEDMDFVHKLAFALSSDRGLLNKENSHTGISEVARKMINNLDLTKTEKELVEAFGKRIANKTNIEKYMLVYDAAAQSYKEYKTGGIEAVQNEFVAETIQELIS